VTTRADVEKTLQSFSEMISYATSFAFRLVQWRYKSAKTTG